jgi:hypothetical protein
MCASAADVPRFALSTRPSPNVDDVLENVGQLLDVLLPMSHVRLPELRSTSRRK